jgi:hypothetical protein
MELNLSGRITKLESLLNRGSITSDEFDSMAATALKNDSNRRKQNVARYHVAITNNTKGAYAYGTTDHYVDTEAECEALSTEWFEQDSIAAVHFLRMPGLQVSSAIKTIDGEQVSTVFAVQDRHHKH